MELAIDRSISRSIDRVINTPPVRNRNRIDIQQIYPVLPTDELVINSENSILGISFDTMASEGNKILSIFNFLQNRGLDTINLLIGDSIYRHTAMIKYQCTEEAGRKIGMAESQRLLNAYTNQLQNNNIEPYKLKVFLTSEIEKREEFSVIHRNIIKLFDENTKFRLSVLNFANHYFKFLFETNSLLDTRNRDIECSCRYLMEELTVLAILNQEGFNTLLYPGFIQTVCDILAMDEPYLTSLFKNYIFVSLRIKRKGL